MAQARSGQDPIAAFQAARRRMVLAFLVLAVVYGIGAVGYWYLGWRHQPGMWPLRDCIYMTAITVTTVGFGEVIEVSAVTGGREWTLVLLVFGISANLYVVSAITSFFVESDFNDVRRYRRLRKRMREAVGHYIVCGAGQTGLHVVEELLAIGHTVVAIDLREDLLRPLQERGVLTLCGDATADETLVEAGIGRARGIVATLDDDKTNMFVVVSARQSNASLRIVTKAVHPSAADKLRRAGADAVVSTTMIGGMRLASELVRPQVVQFLDQMLRDRSANLRIEEAVVGTTGEVVGTSLRQADLRRRCGVLILALRDRDGTLRHAPDPETRISEGQTLIAMGRPEQIADLRKAIGQS